MGGSAGPCGHALRLAVLCCLWQGGTRGSLGLAARVRCMCKQSVCVPYPPLGASPASLLTCTATAGAPESVLDRCTGVLTNDGSVGVQPLTPGLKASLFSKASGQHLVLHAQPLAERR